MGAVGVGWRDVGVWGMLGREWGNVAGVGTLTGREVSTTSCDLMDLN